MPKLYRPRNSTQNALQPSWISMVGSDAQDFLHRLTTINVRVLQQGEGATGFFLNPQGKIRVHFTLWHCTQDEFGFELNAGSDNKWKQELLSTIDQFTFAEKFTVTENPDLSCLWFFLSENEILAGNLEPLHTEQRPTGLRICNHGTRDYGLKWYSIWGTEAVVEEWVAKQFASTEAMKASTVDEQSLNQWRIEAVRPQLDAEITSNANPLEIGLRDGIADNKGCYPGQEVIEKIIALGSPARRLVRIDSKHGGPLPALGAKVTNLAEPPAELGQLTSLAPTSDGFTALAILRKIHAQEGLEVRVEVATDSGSPSPMAAGTIVRIAPYA